MFKQKIELTFESFKRWLGDEEAEERCWKDLCAEAEKREPIVRWAVYDLRTGSVFDITDSEETVNKSGVLSQSGYKVIKLQEVST